MNAVPGGISYTSKGFARGIERPDKVREKVLESLFCPAPVGFSSPDTFRLSEALEAGCFPVVDAQDRWSRERWRGYLRGVGNRLDTRCAISQARYFEEYFEHWGEGEAFKKFIFQVPQEWKWRSVPSRITKAMANMSKLQNPQTATVFWWANFKDKVARKVAALIQEKTSLTSE